MKTYDYVIVGGGSAGCVVANRLTEDGRATVLLLEAGGWDYSPYMRIPVGLLQVLAKHSWQYTAEGNESRPGPAPHWIGGKVLGGSSSVNGQVWTRGEPADFDEWANLGAKGWDYESVLPYFKRAETFAGGANEYRGGSGPLHVSYAAVKHELTDRFIEGAQQVGHRFNEDLNAASELGVGHVQASQRRGWRHSTARAYLAPARRRRNLTIATHAVTTRILFDGQRATGVEYQSPKGVSRAAARREVIVSAGAIESPKLLQLSGVGPVEDLVALGIDVIHDNAGVGRNLQEHPAMTLTYKVTVPTMNMQLTVPSIIRNGLDFVIRGKGAATSPPSHAFVFGKLAEQNSRPDYEIFFAPFGITSAQNRRGPERVLGDLTMMKDPVISIGIEALHPSSRGAVRLRSSAPKDAPLITHELLTDREVEVLKFGAQQARAIVNSPAFRPYVIEQLLPEPSVDSDTAWEDHIRAAARGGHHPIGTCKMGEDPEAVVDSELRVHGVQGLRVADASIMPTLVSGHTNAAAVMIGERAADLIRER